MEDENIGARPIGVFALIQFDNHFNSTLYDYVVWHFYYHDGNLHCIIKYFSSDQWKSLLVFVVENCNKSMIIDFWVSLVFDI